MSETPSWRDLADAMKPIYARHCGGCCLHVVIDDGNIEREFIDWTLEHARTSGHADCIAAAELMARCSLTQIRKARHFVHLPEST